tara:strand:- start:10365 stop:11150 length:786 start_codon:yes stop_codon:yes gene_type:complete
MKFTIDAKEFRTGLEDIMGSGKYAQSGGVKSGVLSEYTYLDLKDNPSNTSFGLLSLWNGDGSYINKVVLDVSILDDSTHNATVNIKTLLPFLKKMSGEIEIAIHDRVTISSANTNITLPRVNQHPHHEVIQRLYLMDLNLDGEMPQFNGKAFEGSFDMSTADFKEVINQCELIGTGVYKLDFDFDENDLGKVEISSTVVGVKRYTTTVSVENGKGYSATVAFTGPLHKFFKGDTITFYVKDEFPLLLVGEDRLLVKVPHME